jgi:lambda repressor-like predicted transcriptional regulator
VNWDKLFASPALMESARRRLSERVVASSECLLWQGCKKPSGYGLMAVGKRNREATHRIAWALHNGQRPPVGMHVMHSCDTPSCVNPAHLSIGTPSDNQMDSSRKGRKNVPKGAAHALSRYTESQFVAAALLFAHGATYRVISEKIGVTRSALMKTLQGHRWPHIQHIIGEILGREPRRAAA